MARIPSTIFENWADGKTITGSDYNREREIMRTAINDFDNDMKEVVAMKVGPEGPQGPMGPAGQGPVGPQGPKGDKGDPGTGSVNSVNGDLGPDIVIDSSDINIIPRKLSTDPGSDYPEGVSMFDVIAATNEGYPLTLGIVLNYKFNNLRFVQFMYKHTSPEVWVRVWYNDTWSEWEKQGAGDVLSVNGQTGEVTISVFSGDYNDLVNKPTIPTNLTATELTLGNFKLAFNATTNSLDIVVV